MYEDEQELDYDIEDSSMDPDEEGFMLGVENREDDLEELQQLEEDDEKAYDKAFVAHKKRN